MMVCSSTCTEMADEVVASAFEKHRRLVEELREAELLGEENDEGVVPLTGGVLEAIEDFPESHAIAGLVGGRDITRRSLHDCLEGGRAGRQC